MKENWKSQKLGALAEFRNGVNFSREDEGPGIPIIKVKDFGDLHHVPTEGLDQLDQNRVRVPSNQLLKNQDILLVRSNGNPALVGRSMIFGGPDNAVTFSGFCIRVRVDFRCVVPAFIHYWLRSDIVRSRFAREGNGTGIQNLSQSFLADIEVILPSLPEQRAIAATLRALDDKIDLNRRTNETLEAMARALFKDWFVDFGPTRAKMEGREPYLAPDIWALFPDRLDEDGKPQGWMASTIGDEVRVVGGSTPSTREPKFWDGGLNWATPKDLSTLTAPVLLQTAHTITEAGLTKISSGLLPVGTVLLSSRAPIGYIAVTEIQTAINQGFIGMICDKRISNVFALLWTQENIDKIHAKANGSTFQEISKGNFRPLAVIIPSVPVLEAFNAVTQPLYQRITQNEREYQSLAQTRDYLLPRLMSGDVGIYPNTPAD